MSDDKAMLKTKDFGPFEVKDEERGEVEAIVATYGVVDKDGDVILPGAIPDGSKVKLSAYGHDVVLLDAPPVGMGEIRSKEGRAIFSGRFFMDTDRGREAFRVVKNLGSDGEWSIGFPERSVRTVELTDELREKGARRAIREMTVLEASPVFMGAQGGTATIATKSERDAQVDDSSEGDQPGGDEIEQKASQNDMREELRRLLTDLEAPGEGGYLYVEDVVDDVVVYQLSDEEGESLYQRAFTVGDDESIEVASERQDVRRVTRFVAVDVEEEGDGAESESMSGDEPQVSTRADDGDDMATEIKRLGRSQEYADALERKHAAEAELERATSRLRALATKRQTEAALQREIEEEVERFQKTRRRLAG